MRLWLEAIRKKANKTQDEVAFDANIARTTYAMIEQGNRNPSVPVAKRIAKVLKFEWTLFFEKECHDSCIESVQEAM